MIFYEDRQDETLWHLASLEKTVEFSSMLVACTKGEKNEGNNQVKLTAS